MILPPRIRIMHQVYGTTPKRTCGECAKLVRHEQSKRWYKCSLTSPSGPAGDWRVSWPACGKFVEAKAAE